MVSSVLVALAITAGEDPSAAIVWMSKLPPELFANAIVVPSGDQVGEVDEPDSVVASCVGVWPLVSISQIWVGEPAGGGVSSNTILVPSGENSGSATRWPLPDAKLVSLVGVPPAAGISYTFW